MYHKSIGTTIMCISDEESTILGPTVTFFGDDTITFANHPHTLRYLYEDKLPFHSSYVVLPVTFSRILFKI